MAREGPSTYAHQEAEDAAARAPGWLWDSDRLRIVAADPAAVRFWGAATEEDLAARRHFADRGLGAEMASIARVVETFRAVRTILQLAPLGRALSTPAEIAVETLSDGRLGFRVRHLSVGPDTVRGRLLLDHAPAAIAAFDAGGTALYRNRADLALFAAEAESLTSRFADPAAAEAALAAALADGVGQVTTSMTTQLGPRLCRLTLRQVGPPDGETAEGRSDRSETLAYVEEIAPARVAADRLAVETAPEPAAPPPPALGDAPAPEIGRVARLAAATLEALPVGLGLFAGANWTLYYGNPTLADWLEAAGTQDAPGLAALFPRHAAEIEADAAAIAAGADIASRVVRLGAGPGGRRVRATLSRLVLPPDLAAAAIGPILVATLAPVEARMEAAAPGAEAEAEPVARGGADSETAGERQTSLVEALEPLAAPRKTLRLGRAVRTELTSVLGFAEALAEGRADHDINLARAYLANIIESGRRMAERLSALDAALVETARESARRRDALELAENGVRDRSGPPAASGGDAPSSPRAPDTVPAPTEKAAPNLDVDDGASAGEAPGAETGQGPSQAAGQETGAPSEPTPEPASDGGDAPALRAAAETAGARARRTRASRSPLGAGRGWTDPLALLEAVRAEFGPTLADRLPLVAGAALSGARARLDAALFQDALRDALAMAADALNGSLLAATHPERRGEIRAGFSASGALEIEITIPEAPAALTDVAAAKRRAAVARVRSSAAAAGASAEIETPEEAEAVDAALRIRLSTPADRIALDRD